MLQGLGVIIEAMHDVHEVSSPLATALDVVVAVQLFLAMLSQYHQGSLSALTGAALTVMNCPNEKLFKKVSAQYSPQDTIFPHNVRHTARKYLDI